MDRYIYRSSDFCTLASRRIRLLLSVLLFSFVPLLAQPGEDYYLPKAAAELKRLDDKILKTPDDPDLYFQRSQIYLNWFRGYPKIVEYHGTVYAIDPGSKALSDLQRAISLEPRGPYFVALGKYYWTVFFHKQAEIGEVTAAARWPEIKRRYWEDELLATAIDNYRKGVEKSRDGIEKARALSNFGSFYHYRAMEMSSGALSKIVRSEKQAQLVYDDYDQTIDLEKKVIAASEPNTHGLSLLRDLYREKAAAAVEFEDAASGLEALGAGIKAITALGGANEFACYLYVRRGETYTLQKDHAAALKDFTYAIDSQMSNCLDVFEKRADTYAVLGNWRAAIDDYSREMALFEHRVPRLHAKRGNAYLRSGEPEKAVADLDPALEFSACGPLFRIRAEALRLLGKNDLADRDEQKAAEYSRGRPNDQCAFR